MDKISEHYVKMAKEWGASKQSTMRDVNIRDLEVDQIIHVLGAVREYIPSPRVLEIGCGNGYTIEQIKQRLDLPQIVCIDYCEELLEIARRRELTNITFKKEDVQNLSFDDSSIDVVLTERCLINLDAWEKQQKALDEITRVLRPGGVYIMVESFTDGLANLNGARKAVGLEPIPQPFHNLYFEKDKFLEWLGGKFEYFSTAHPEADFGNCQNFLSSYYFGSKVIYPALIPKGIDVEYNNPFVEFFRFMPGYGNFSYIQMHVLEKNITLKK